MSNCKLFKDNTEFYPDKRLFDKMHNDLHLGGEIVCNVCNRIFNESYGVLRIDGEYFVRISELGYFYGPMVNNVGAIIRKRVFKKTIYKKLDKETAERWLVAFAYIIEADDFTELKIPRQEWLANLDYYREEIEHHLRWYCKDTSYAIKEDENAE